MVQALRQHAAESDVLVTAAALSTLTRVASACACLHLRSEILATPDVVLSIMLLEESFKHQVIMCIVLHHHPDRTGIACA